MNFRPFIPVGPKSSIKMGPGLCCMCEFFSLLSTNQNLARVCKFSFLDNPPLLGVIVKKIGIYNHSKNGGTLVPVIPYRDSENTTQETQRTTYPSCVAIFDHSFHVKYTKIE